MSDLTKVEKAKLRKLFATSDGSILKFNNCGFEQFFLLNIEIYKCFVLTFLFSI